MRIAQDLKIALEEVKLLTDIDDSFGHVLIEDSTKGIFIQVVDYGEGMEYLIEANTVDESGAFTPCSSHNESAPFGDYAEFLTALVAHIERELPEQITPATAEEVRRQDNIQWARDILENYREIIADYDSIIEDEEQLEMFAYNLNDKCLSNNGERELEAIHELFNVIED